MPLPSNSPFAIPFNYLQLNPGTPLQHGRILPRNLRLLPLGSKSVAHTYLGLQRTPYKAICLDLIFDRPVIKKARRGSHLPPGYRENTRANEAFRPFPWPSKNPKVGKILRKNPPSGFVNNIILVSQDPFITSNYSVPLRGGQVLFLASTLAMIAPATVPPSHNALGHPSDQIRWLLFRFLFPVQ